MTAAERSPGGWGPAEAPSDAPAHVEPSSAGETRAEARNGLTAHASAPGSSINALTSTAAGAGGESAPVFRSYIETNTTSSRDDSPIGRGAWIDDVEQLTKAHRTKRAGHHRHRALHWRRRQRDEADPGIDYGSRVAWHEARANGQRNRFETLRECESQTAVYSCGECGTEVARAPTTCGVRRLCDGCRDRFARRSRARFRIARWGLLREHRALLRPGAPGGRWSEKLLTLTLPHSGDLERDIAELPRAWCRFRRLLNEHLRLDRGIRPRPVYLRVIEVTPGEDERGHAHLHVYLFAPFLDHVVVRVLWSRALGRAYACPTRSREDVLASIDDARRRAELARRLQTRRGPHGRPLAEIPWPVVDVRACDANVERELIKYLRKNGTKRTDGTCGLIAPELFAATYRGLEGVRALQSSRGFRLGDARLACSCPTCGIAGHLRRRIDASMDQTTLPSPR